jgi:hypothetical protein
MGGRVILAQGRHGAGGTAAFSERQLRDALAQFATGVTIV